MKCQKCNQEAVQHFAEIIGEETIEVHLCQKHYAEYLLQKQGDVASGEENVAVALANHIAQQMLLSKAADEMAQMDDEMCPTCGITFFEFRTHNWLGCPDDYTFFWKQLELLLVNIHGELTHIGKVPKHSAELSAKCTLLIRLRSEMQEAAQMEEYERASKLRDQIRQIEEEAKR